MDTTNFFKHIYEQASTNAILIMDTSGIVREVNLAFTRHFGYTSADLAGKSFKLLFTKGDQDKRMPEKELARVIKTGQSNDDNFVVDKQGVPKRSSGESILMATKGGDKLIAKLIVNLHAKKYLRIFFTETDKLLEAGLSSSTEVPMVILDTGMKIIQVNKPFRTLFEIKENPRRGSSLASLQHAFWKRDDVKQMIRETIVANAPLKRKRFELQLPDGKKKITLDSKIMESTAGKGKKVFVIIDEMK